MDAIKEKKFPVTIAVLQWFITTVLQVDRLFFTYDYETWYFIAVKMFYLIFLAVFWRFAFGAVKKIKSGDRNWTRGFFVFKVYLSVIMCFLLILWPGTWSWDDIGVLFEISHYGGWASWQNVITGIYQDVLLQILPFPGGIILLQNVIISLCVAFVVTKLEIVLGIGQIRNRALDIFVKLLPFLLPPVLRYQFSGYRMGLYVYIELVMLIMLIGTQNDMREWGYRHLALFCMLCVVAASWRTESFVYIPCASVLLLFAKKQVIPNKKKILCIAVMAAGVLAIDGFQKSELGNSNYEVISLLSPGAELVRAADCNEDAEELGHIDKVASLETIYNNPEMSGTDLYWCTDIVKGGYTDDNYRAFLKAIIKLSIKYPKVVVAERWNLFIEGSGIASSANFIVERPAELFEEGNGNGYAEKFVNSGWIAVRPVFKTVRRIFIKVLGMGTNGSFLGGMPRRLVWNSIIPELVLLYAWMELLFKKKWYWSGVCAAVLMRLPVVVMTQPVSWFMYVLSFYFLGYVFLVYRILLEWDSHKKKKGQEA